MSGEGHAAAHEVAGAAHAGPNMGLPPEGTWLHFLWNKFHIPDFLAVAILAALMLTVAVVLATRRLKPVPEGPQNLIELIVEAFTGLCRNVIGDKGPNWIPSFIASLFLYILLMNYMGLLPGFISPTAHPYTTLSLAIISLLVVHYIAIRENGIKNYLSHYIDKALLTPFTFWMIPLTALFHIIGELAKVLSLSIRLFGNIFGEDTAIYNFAVIGILIWSGVGIPSFLKVPLPFQLPILLLHLLVGFVQALVFSMLVTVYIAVFLEHAGHEGHEG